MHSHSRVADLRADSIQNTPFGCHIFMKAIEKKAVWSPQSKGIIQNPTGWVHREMVFFWGAGLLANVSSPWLFLLTSCYRTSSNDINIHYLNEIAPSCIYWGRWKQGSMYPGWLELLIPCLCSPSAGMTGEPLYTWLTLIFQIPSSKDISPCLFTNIPSIFG